MSNSGNNQSNEINLDEIRKKQSELKEGRVQEKIKELEKLKEQRKKTQKKENEILEKRKKTQKTRNERLQKQKEQLIKQQEERRNKRLEELKQLENEIHEEESNIRERNSKKSKKKVADIINKFENLKNTHKKNDGRRSLEQIKKRVQDGEQKRVQDRIEELERNKIGLYSNVNAFNKMYEEYQKGIITNLNSEDTYDIQFINKNEEYEVPVENIREVKTPIHYRPLSSDSIEKLMTIENETELDGYPLNKIMIGEDTKKKGTEKWRIITPDKNTMTFRIKKDAYMYYTNLKNFYIAKMIKEGKNILLSYNFLLKNDTYYQLVIGGLSSGKYFVYDIEKKYKPKQNYKIFDKLDNAYNSFNKKLEKINERGDDIIGMGKIGDEDKIINVIKIAKDKEAKDKEERLINKIQNQNSNNIHSIRSSQRESSNLDAYNWGNVPRQRTPPREPEEKDDEFAKQYLKQLELDNPEFNKNSQSQQEEKGNFLGRWFGWN